MFPLILILMNISVYELGLIATHPLVLGFVLASLLFTISAHRYESRQEAQKLAHERHMRQAQKMEHLKHQYWFIQQVTDQNKR